MICFFLFIRRLAQMFNELELMKTCCSIFIYNRESSDSDEAISMCWCSFEYLESPHFIDRIANSSEIKSSGISSLLFDCPILWYFIVQMIVSHPTLNSKIYNIEFGPILLSIHLFQPHFYSGNNRLYSLVYSSYSLNSRIDICYLISVLFTLLMLHSSYDYHDSRNFTFEEKIPLPSVKLDIILFDF